MTKFTNWMLTEESGQGMVEYGLILALISVVAIAVLTNIGQGLLGKFKKVEAAIPAS